MQLLFKLFYLAGIDLKPIEKFLGWLNDAYLLINLLSNSSP